MKFTKGIDMTNGHVNQDGIIRMCLGLWLAAMSFVRCHRRIHVPDRRGDGGLGFTMRDVVSRCRLTEAVDDPGLKALG